jgi:hypothetical protein
MTMSASFISGSAPLDWDTRRGHVSRAGVSILPLIMPYILLSENDGPCQSTMRVCLAEVSPKVTEVHNGREGLALAARKLADLVLTVASEIIVNVVNDL